MKIDCPTCGDEIDTVESKKCSVRIADFTVIPEGEIIDVDTIRLKKYVFNPCGHEMLGT